jgi:uncharacterized protein (TIGR01777 family)
MRLVITGGTGFIGRALCDRLVGLGHAVTVLTRDAARARDHLPPQAAALGWSPAVGASPGLMRALEESDAVVNLAGESVGAGRWSEPCKAAIRESRVGTTAVLVSALSRAKHKPAVLLSASAIGYYGSREDEALTEEAGAGRGFLAELCQEWETAASAAQPLGIRVVLPRIGVVLGPGGALAKMLPAFRMGLGGPIGRGTQWMSWIHRSDLVELLLTLLTQDIRGPINATAPEPVTNHEFSRVLGQVLHRPTWARVPAFMLKLVWGQMAEELLLTGQRVVPQRAQAMGFRFRYPTLGEALHDLVR